MKANNDSVRLECGYMEPLAFPYFSCEISLFQVYTDLLVKFKNCIFSEKTFFSKDKK